MLRIYIPRVGSPYRGVFPSRKIPHFWFLSSDVLPILAGSVAVVKFVSNCVYGLIFILFYFSWIDY